MDDNLKDIVKNSLNINDLVINEIDEEDFMKIIYIIIGLVLKSSLDDLESFTYIKTLLKIYMLIEKFQPLIIDFLI